MLTTYPLPAGTLPLSSGVLWRARQSSAAQWPLLVIVVVGSLRIGWEIVQQFRRREFGVDIILLHDTFAPLPLAFGEGQRIRNGLHHIIMLFLARTLFVALMLLAVVAMTDSFAFTPKQNAILAFITGGIPALALAVWAQPQRSAPRSLLHDVLHFSLPAGISMSVIWIGIFLGFVTVLQTNVQQSAQTALTEFGILAGLLLLLYVTPVTPIGRSRSRWQVTGAPSGWREGCWCCSG